MKKDKKNKLNILGQNEKKSSDISRRKFLKILGTSSALGLSSCADDASQKVYSYLKGDNQVIPGVSNYFTSTCTECSAGCGVIVKNRDGRATKIEGNIDHPVNKGSLCAIGQSGLQHLYDPDRIREPQFKDAKNLKVSNWEDVLSKSKNALSEFKDKKNYILSKPLTGTLEKLVNEYAEKTNSTIVYFDVTQNNNLASASEDIFGIKEVPTFNFDKADLVLNFGADFLETWVSPCLNAATWAKSRATDHPTKYIHIEPRLSLTAANADLWVGSELGKELEILKYICKELSSKYDLTPIKKYLNYATASETKTGLSSKILKKISKEVLAAKTPLFIAGGALTSSNIGRDLEKVTLFLNSLISKNTDLINFNTSYKVKSSFQDLNQLITDLDNKKVGSVLVYDCNPVFLLSSGSGFEYKLKKADYIISASSHLDETAKIADLYLPTHTNYESWGDYIPNKNTYSIIQPTMNPLFDTKHIGDILITLANLESKDFYSYFIKNWEIIQKEVNNSKSFKDFFKEVLNNGGVFLNKKTDIKFSNSISISNQENLSLETSNKGTDELILYPYFSIKTFDGRSANRPVMQELPDPMIQTAWDSWAEINPETAADLNLKSSDVVKLSNFNGELNIPVFITDKISKGIIAVPTGQGHTDYGRYAKSVQGGNVFNLLSSDYKDKDNLNLVSVKVNVSKSSLSNSLANFQGSNSQKDRHLARVKFIGDHKNHNEHDHSDHSDSDKSHKKTDNYADHKKQETAKDDSHHENLHADDHHQAPQMYNQRKHPLYRWAMAIDLNSCTGCSACVTACAIENNIPSVGKNLISQGREMSWLRIERYFDETPNSEELTVNFLPMMCQHCNNAPCEPVCPVYATYHNEEGLNAMVYNRCVGTRYCSNNCSYKVRRFNWFEFTWPEPLNLSLNPDVVKRTSGVMEKCSFCVQRITDAKDTAKDKGRSVKDGEVIPACAQTCPTNAITFGNLNDKNSNVSKISKDKRAYKILDHHLNTGPSVSYLEKLKYKV